MCLILALPPLAANADHILVAVAANFATPMRAITREFQKQTGHTVSLSPGSSGKLFAQINHGAPFDLFLSADQKMPKALEASGLAADGSRFTYALGALILWSSDDSLIDGTDAVLTKGAFKKLAIANPRLAPYGRAAQEVLENLQITGYVEHRLVYGENISQTYQFVSSGNAELGFVALSQMATVTNDLAKGSSWTIPETLYTPIRQDAVLLTRALDNGAARDFLAFLKRRQTKKIIENFGYRAPQVNP